MKNVKYITISGVEFIITKEVDYNNAHYMVAIDSGHANTVVVLKQKIVDGKEFVESVNDEEEMQMILEYINKA